MPLRRTKPTRNVQSKEELSREMRHSKLALFIQQFEKEAQERMNELEAKMENMLATVEKVFKVELMKMPPSLQNTLIGDLISEEEVSASEVSIAMKSELREMPQPLRRMPSKRAKSTDSPDQSSPTQRPSSKASKGVKGTKRTRTLVCSNSTGNLTSKATKKADLLYQLNHEAFELKCDQRIADKQVKRLTVNKRHKQLLNDQSADATSGRPRAEPSVTAKRTQSRLASRKTNEPSVPNQSKPKLRSVVSAGDLHCSMAGSAAHITVTTARGQMVSFSEETKDDINWDLLDDVAWCQIQKLSGLMDYLSRRSRCHR